MAEYIEREAVCRAYMDLCLAKSKLAKARKGAAFFQSDLLPETEPTVKELFRLVMATPAADVAPVVHGRWINHLGGWVNCSECKTVGSPQWKGCPVCLARMDGE